jgi:predicted RecB family endonuclease
VSDERSSIDDIIDVYKRDVDRTLIRQRLTRSIEERLEDLMELQRFAEELHRAGRVTFEADD